MRSGNIFLAYGIRHLHGDNSWLVTRVLLPPWSAFGSRENLVKTDHVWMGQCNGLRELLVPSRGRMGTGRSSSVAWATGTVFGNSFGKICSLISWLNGCWKTPAPWRGPTGTFQGNVLKQELLTHLVVEWVLGIPAPWRKPRVISPPPPPPLPPPTTIPNPADPEWSMRFHASRPRVQVARKIPLESFDSSGRVPQLHSRFSKRFNFCSL